MAYPTGTDLGNFLIARGILSDLPGDLDDLDEIMTGVVEDFEQDTGWFPFLADADPEDRYFTLNGSSTLFLHMGIVDDTIIISIEDEVLDQVDPPYSLQPTGSVANGKPWTRIEFTYDVSSTEGGVEVHAIFGYTATLPTNVKRALLRRGASEYLNDISNTVVGTSGQVTEIKQDDVTKKYGNAGGSLQDDWNSYYDRIVMKYLAPWKVLA